MLLTSSLKELMRSVPGLKGDAARTRLEAEFLVGWDSRAKNFERQFTMSWP